MNVRRLTPSDALCFQELRLFALQESPASFASSYEEEKTYPLSMIEGRLSVRPDRGAFGAFDGQELVGIVSLIKEDRLKLAHKALIVGMYVAPRARRRRVGSALLEEALALARSVASIRQVALGVNAENTAAIALYERHGFKVFGHEREALLIDGKIQDEIHMQLLLPERASTVC